MSKSHQQSVIDYYNTRESKKGYMLLLGGTKHFGYYNKGDRPWQFNKALRQMEQKLGETIDLPAGSVVLDAGCGMGDVASYLAAHFGLKVTGIDLLDFNLKEANSRAKTRGLTELLTFKKMSYDTLNFPDNSFDAIYTIETFVHAENPGKVLKEFYRVLKPTGKLVHFEYSHDPLDKIPPKAASAITEVNTLAAMPTFQLFKHGVHENLLVKTGFENITVRNIFSHIEPMLRMFQLAAYIPYYILAALGKRDRIVNAMSAVELWKYRQYIRFNIVSAHKK